MHIEMPKLFTLMGAALALACASSTPSAPPPSLDGIENAYADFNDASGAISLIESGLRDSFEGRTRGEWAGLQEQARDGVQKGLKDLAGQNLSATDRRAIDNMRSSMIDADDSGSLAPGGNCADAQRKDIEYAPLRTALYACFGMLSKFNYEGATVTRVGAFDLLTRMDEPERRKQLFLQFMPLWQSINGKNERDSPYRRVIAMAAEHARADGTAIDAAAKTVGASAAEVEQWLVQILQAWRNTDDGEPVEPWDYRIAAARPSVSSATRSRAARCSRSTNGSISISVRRSASGT
jgi:hypothetical protein